MESVCVDSVAVMRSRSRPRSSARHAWRAVALLVAAATLGALAPATVAAAPRPAKLAGTSASLSGSTLTVLWAAKRTGQIEIAVRRPVNGKQRTLTRRVAARRGQADVRLGSAPDRAAVRVRLRRCTGAGRTRRCGRWTAWVTPSSQTSTPGTTTPTTGSGGTPTPTPVGEPAPGTTTPVTTAPGDGPTIGGCPQMPSSWALNQRVDSLPLAAKSDAYVNYLGAGGKIHPDFGSADLGAGPEGFGIPFRVVPETTAPVPVVFGGVDDDDIANYSDESDPGPYPIPLDTPIEGGAGAPRTADRHVLVVQQGACQLFEMGQARVDGSQWRASVVAKFNLTTGAPRPIGWTSADAAGLPILPLLARYDEAASGRIKHAIRMTSRGIANAYVPPASHFAPTSSDPSAPPMGQRFRMKASYDLSRLTGHARVIAQAMKEYGLVLADTGSSWFVTGAPDRRWDEDNLQQLKSIPGSAFEAVDSARIVTR
jgi:hypothetical protein